MANGTNALHTHQKIEKLINSSRFNESFLMLKNFMQPLQKMSKELDKLQNLESTYKYMLDYLFEGHEDPSRKEVIEQMKDSLHHANDILLRETLMKDNGDLYSSTRRMFELRKTTLQSLIDEYYKNVEETFKDQPELCKKTITESQSRLINEIFNYVWTMFGADPEEYQTLSIAFESEGLPEYIKLLMVSAITLGNISYFDPEAFEILLNQYESKDSIPMKSKVLVGIILISLLHPQRLAGNINLRSRLMLTAEDDDLKKHVSEVLFNVIRTYDTKRIDNKMRNEVIPGLMKINPEIIDKMRNLASDADNFLSDINPEWEEMLESSDIGKKLQEINDMQLEGADVMVTAFSNLKGFPFFNQVSNWFMPFVAGHYEFVTLPIDRDENVLKRFTSVMCDSDLHSFLLSLGTMPEDKRNQMLQTMQAQMKEAYEAMSNAIGETEGQQLSKKIRHDLQDLYRFFKFYRKKNDFTDPFSRPFLQSDLQPLLPILDLEVENLKLVAEFYFKNKYYDEAAVMFEMIDNIEPGNFKIWEKIGFCHDRMKRYEKAAQWYSKADIVIPGNKWLEKKLAVALKNSGRIEEALKYYEKSLNNEPENYHLLMSAGECMLSLGNTKDALKQFYHAQYIEPNKKDASRAVAWAELLAGNNEKAREQYSKLTEAPDADKIDFLNAAHCALSSGNLKEAVRLYRCFVDKTDNKDITTLLLALRDDAEITKQLGIKTSDLRLIVDKIRYDA